MMVQRRLPIKHLTYVNDSILHNRYGFISCSYINHIQDVCFKVLFLKTIAITNQYALIINYQRDPLMKFSYDYE